MSGALGKPGNTIPTFATDICNRHLQRNAGYTYFEDLGDLMV